MTAYLDRIDSDVSGVFSPSTSASMKASWTDFARGRPAASVSFVLPTPSSLSFLTVCCTRLWSEEAIVASSPPVPHGAHRDRWAAFSSVRRLPPLSPPLPTASPQPSSPLLPPSQHRTAGAALAALALTVLSCRRFLSGSHGARPLLAHAHIYGRVPSDRTLDCFLPSMPCLATLC